MKTKPDHSFLRRVNKNFLFEMDKHIREVGNRHQLPPASAGGGCKDKKEWALAELQITDI